MAAGKSPPGEMVDDASGVKDDGNCFDTYEVHRELKDCSGGRYNGIFV